jgi:hypothetical protein
MPRQQRVTVLSLIRYGFQVAQQVRTCCCACTTVIMIRFHLFKSAVTVWVCCVGWFSVTFSPLLLMQTSACNHSPSLRLHKLSAA